MVLKEKKFLADLAKKSLLRGSCETKIVKNRRQFDNRSITNYFESEQKDLYREEKLQVSHYRSTPAIDVINGIRI